MPEPKVTTLQRGVERGGSIFAYAIAALVVAIIFGSLLVYRFFSLKTQLEQVTQLTAQAQSDYDALKPVADDVTTINTIVTAINNAKEQQLLYDNILTALAKESLKVISYKSVSVDSTGKVILAGSVDTYNNFAKVVKAFRQSEGEESGLTKLVDINQVTQGQLSQSAEEGASKILVTDFILTFNIDTALYKPQKIQPTAVKENQTLPVSEAPVEVPVAVPAEEVSVEEVPAPTTPEAPTDNLLDAFDQSTNQPPQSSTL